MSLRPVHTAFRHHLALDGLWEWQPRPGEAWRPIAVPASWNDQFATGRDHLGPVQYRTSFPTPPRRRPDDRVTLRFDSAVHSASVRVNGTHVGGHVGGHLPFTIDVTDALTGDAGEANRLEVEVDGNLSRDTVPPGGSMTWSVPTHPSVSFDFFPYSGLNRPVHLATAPAGGIEAVRAVATAAGSLSVEVDHGRPGAVVQLSVRDADGGTRTTSGESHRAELSVDGVVPWSTDTPALYGVGVELVEDGEVVDCYRLDVGFRDIAVEGNRLLLNGEPLWLKGFGRHEDLPISGRGLNLAACVKDMDLLRWCGANSFRTTHYPYAEETLDLADRLGVLVISETPAVGLNWGDGEEHEAARLAACRQQTAELIARDRNHPSVIMWSLANEPHSAHQEARSEPFFAELYRLARSLDHTRPVTHVAEEGRVDAAHDHADVLCLNRYGGWYSHNGRLADALVDLRTNLEQIHQARPDVPVILTEFGADTVAGNHDAEAAMWSEEFQAAMIEGYLEVCESLDFVVGAHVWNMCDFAVAQSFLRPTGMNLKGVFTRDRRPKLAARVLRARWLGT